MKNLLNEYLKKQESSKWLHSNKNDYEINKISHNTNSNMGIIRSSLQ